MIKAEATYQYLEEANGNGMFFFTSCCGNRVREKKRGINMADIELVIRIPEELFSEIDDENYQSKISWYDTTLYCAIKDGTPLPKGHGNLKDADAICKDIISALGIRNEDYLLEAEKAIYKRINDVPTIIEADKV